MSPAVWRALSLDALAKLLCETDPAKDACAHKLGRMTAACAYHTARARALLPRLRALRTGAAPGAPPP